MAKLNITWPQFAVCNHNPTKDFEDMCRRLFTARFLKGKGLPHADHNNPGIEVLPILEPETRDGQPPKRISFQCKYVGSSQKAYYEFQKSARITAEKYKGELDLVYLFCNKTLTTTAGAYQSIVKIHSDAGIETWPISDSEVLDLAAEYPEIAECFFQPRVVAGVSGLQPAVINGTPVFIITPDRIAPASSEKTEDEELLGELISEKLTKCKNYALALELTSLKKEVERLISLGADNNELDFYQFLLQIHEGNYSADVSGKCNEMNKSEGEWLAKFYATPFVLPPEEFIKHSSIVQVFTLDRMFTLKYWQEIIALWNQTAALVDLSIRNLFDFYYGLSLLNIQENHKAKEILGSLYERTHEQRMLFYEICAGIRVENGVYQSGMTGNHDKLADLIKQLESLKGIREYSQQELFVAALKLESAYHLGTADKAYLEKAIGEFDFYSESVRENSTIRYYFALCLELKGNRDKAADIYEGLDWKSDPVIAERYMICLIMSEQPQKAIVAYSEILQKDVRHESAYLLALSRNGEENFFDELEKALDKYRDRPADLFSIAFLTDKEGAVRRAVHPIVREAVTEESISVLPEYQKVELVIYLAHCGEIELIEKVLDTFTSLSEVNKYVIIEIYKALFDVANLEYCREDNPIQVPDALEATDRIADKFLEVNVSRKYFLQIKVLCAGAKKLPYSCLRYSKELFDITHDAETARCVVGLLFDRKETKISEYEPYLEELKKSDKPDHCMVTAGAMLLLGRSDAADFYAYKALYLLNGEDDYQIYRSYLGFYYYNLHRLSDDTAVHSVRGGTVVTLEEDGAGKDSRFDICLDQERDFSDETNRSMGIAHIASGSLDYIKLHGSGLEQVLRLGDRKYKIVEITPRIQYGLRFIYKKIQENPEMFKGLVWMISTENIKDMIKQIRELADNSERIKSLLASYNFEDNEVGLPIDAVASGDYSRYIQTLKYLLYQQDEAFYAGQPIYENEGGQKYVPGLATLVLLSVLGRMDVLDEFKKRIIIPESYIAFFYDEYAKAAGMNQVSDTTLYFAGDKPVIADLDKAIPEIWESILIFCRSCQIETVSDQERIDFTMEDGLTGERFITGFGLSMIQLDAILLSKRERATLLCDDLFFRKIASWIGVRNLNIVSLVQHYTNPDYMVPFIKELSKTNYIYIPFQARNDDEFAELLENVLDGKKKGQFYYNEIIQKVIETRNRVLRDF